jgi:hypothetical protein
VTHHDTLAVAGQHQQIDCCRRWLLSMAVEGVEVHRGPAGEVFDLPFPELLAGTAFDGVHGTLEGAP